MRKYIIAFLLVVICDTLALLLLVMPGSPLAARMSAVNDGAPEATSPVQMEAPPVESTEAPTETTEAPPETTLPEPTATEPVKAEPQTFTLTFVGNCTLGSTVKNFNYQHGFIKTIGEDYRYPFANVLDYFENDDFTMLNLEGVLADEGKAAAGKQYPFRGPTAYVGILSENSVEAVSLSNNHTMDFGEAGYLSTASALEGAGISYAEQDKTLTVTTESGLTIGIYAVNLDHLVKDEIVAAISQLEADPEIDLVIFSAHWGNEDTSRPNSQQTELAHAAIDAGADIVYGTHPYTLQPIEQYNGGIIYYSLGNFSYGGNNNPKDFNTALVQQEVVLDGDGNLSLGSMTVVPCAVSSIPNQNNFQPIPYEVGSDGYKKAMTKLGLS